MTLTKDERGYIILCSQHEASLIGNGMVAFSAKLKDLATSHAFAKEGFLADSTTCVDIGCKILQFMQSKPLPEEREG